MIYSSIFISSSSRPSLIVLWACLTKSWNSFFASPINFYSSLISSAFVSSFISSITFESFRWISTDTLILSLFSYILSNFSFSISGLAKSLSKTSLGGKFCSKSGKILCTTVGSTGSIVWSKNCSSNKLKTNFWSIKLTRDYSIC